MNAKEIFDKYSKWFDGDFSIRSNVIEGHFIIEGYNYIWNVRIGKDLIMEIMTNGKSLGRIYSEKEDSSFELKIINIQKKKDEEYPSQTVEDFYSYVPYHVVLELIYAYRNN